MPEGGHSESKSMVPRLIGQVIHLLEPDLAADGYDLLDVRIFQGGGRFQVRVYVDLVAGGITLDLCARAARTVGMLLEEADLFPGQYVIEVSSPGIRRPLRKLSHFEAAVGQKVDLKLKPGSGRQRVKGILEAVEGTRLVVLPGGGPDDGQEPPALRLELEEIAEANLDPEFDVQAIINADRRRRKDERREKRRAKARKGRKARPKAGKDKAGKGKAGGNEPGPEQGIEEGPPDQ